MDFDIVLIIVFVLAVVIFIQLRNALGRRTGNERPPFDPYSRPSKAEMEAREENNVITMPRREEREPDDFSDIDAVAPEGSALNNDLRAARAIDPAFAPASFCNGVRMAYEMIMTSFANGDRATLKNLLSKEVYEGFAGALDERIAQGEKVEFSFVGIESADIVAVKLEKSVANIAVQLVAEVISATYDKNGELVDGDPQVVAEVRDLWTFARDLRARDPNWRLVSTDDGEEA